ncbi:LysR substrate-binding domain-containing protein [Roseibium sp.]|uniref:LysR substrate-binding domain-containing protein n=1 Tax=Roseibium sp. TaxID=1936156 RepID=UPI003A981695
MPYRPSPRQLEYFIAVAETGHFGDAAARCNVSQPTLSAQLKLMEDSLGVVLIDRGGGVVKPTPVGENLLGLARKTLETLDEMVLQAGARIGQMGGLVRLGVAPTFGPYFMPYLLARLYREWPGLELYIREERPDILQSMLEEGALDCILTPARLVPEKMEAVVFCREEVLLGVCAHEALAGKESLELADLKGQTLLTMGPGYKLYEEVIALARATGGQPREDYQGTSLDALRQMISIGMGISLFPACYIHSEFPKEENVSLHSIANFPMRRELTIAWRRGSVRAHHYAKFAEQARQVASELKIPGLEAIDAKP